MKGFEMRWKLREPLKIRFGVQANLFDSGRRQIKVALATAKAHLSSLPEYKKLLLAAQKQLLELPLLFCLVLFAAMSLPATADVDLTAHIANPSFEAPGGLFPGESLDGLEGWDSYSVFTHVNTHGTPGPETQHLSSSPSASDGFQCADLYASLSSQHLGTLTIQPNTIYTLTVDVAVQSTSPAPDAAWLLLGIDAYESIERLATFGSVWDEGLLSEHDPNFLPAGYDTWHPVSISFDSSAIDPGLIGDTLYIFALGDWMKLDNFTLTATGTSVNLTVAVSAGAEDAVLVPAAGAGVYPVGDGWTVPLDAMAKFVNCPDLYTFSQWVGADITVDNITEVTISGNTTVTAQYTTTSPGCVAIVEPREYINVGNPSFESQVLADGAVVAGPPLEWGLVGGSHFIKNPAATEGLLLNYGMQGENALFTFGAAGQYAQIYQNLGEVVEENTTYRYTVDVFVPSDDYYPNSWLELKLQILGGTTGVVGFGAIAPLTGFMSYNADEWFEVSFDWVHTNTDTGSILQIMLSQAGMYVDNVRVSKVRTVQGVEAAFTLESSPVGAVLSPDAGVYTLAIGYEMPFAAVSPDVVVCPEVHDFYEWQGGNGRITRRELRDQRILVDDNMTVTAAYTSNGSQWDSCGDICNPHLQMDLDYSCKVDLGDFDVLAKDWPASPGSELYIFNSSFEYPALAIGGTVTEVPYKWFVIGNNPTIYNTGHATDGRNILSVSLFGSTFYQGLSYLFEANTSYRLMVDMMVPSNNDGVSWDPVHAWWELKLQSQVIGDIAVTSGTTAADPSIAYDQRYTISCDFDSSTDAARVGEGIQFVYSGANVYLDNFRLVKMEEPSIDYLVSLANQWLEMVP